MGYFGIPFRNGVPIGLGSIVGFGAPQEFSPSELFPGGTAGAWYDPSDLSTLFTTSAGTTQCAMPGQGSAVSVGLMLDKSQNGVGTNGAYRYNLLTYTEQFDNAAWVKDGSTAANTTATTDPLGGNTADVLTATLALYAYTYQPTPVSTITATFSCYVKAATASVFWLYYESGGPNGVAYFGTDLTTQVVAGSSQTPSNLTITSVGNGWFRISAQWSTVAGLRNFGVGISDAKGSQAITIGRAGYIWGAQVASAAAPTAYQRIDANWYSAVPGNHAIAFNDTTARPELRARVNLLVATATLSTQSVTTQATSYTLSFAGTGSITLSGTATGSYSAGTHTITCTAGTLTLTVSGTVTTADLRPANSGALLPAYQAVVDANTYDTSGFPLYLRFDGIDDSMYTPANLNLSGTDKVAVFAGVRKLSDGVLMLTEFGPVVDTTNGSFALLVPGSARWSSRLRGTAYCYYDSATYTAPITNVIATSYDIAGAARADEIQPRINGVLNQTNGVGADAGTGNFSSLPLFIGSRNNASVLFNGNIYSLIVVGSAVSAGNISATEQWVAGKTGIVIP